ncbi:hypothetical protein FPV33_18135 [Klebsiella aerogenes]|nr:hypothetical protein C0Q87_03755 [Klebsiella aerogenes]QDR57105.1 hypothetical protein FPV33_18135 [Klebsiella aerogenes]TSI55881.1 hypothetical protein FPI68_11385 [Klebsiella aerogenes]TSI74651.1 hypothetical protein FPI67_11385 [Klebsiella aerogenes]TSI93591.1 hypothetical protein FPI76_11385 [Klebsiella aerogenes]
MLNVLFILHRGERIIISYRYTFVAMLSNIIIIAKYTINPY